MRSTAAFMDLQLTTYFWVPNAAAKTLFRAADYWALWSFENVDKMTWWRTDEWGRSAASLGGRPSAGLPPDMQTSRCCKSSLTAPLSRWTGRWAILLRLRLRAEPKRKSCYSHSQTCDFALLTSEHLYKRYNRCVWHDRLMPVTILGRSSGSPSG